jgi:ABC-2 type transport system permease protein
MRAKQAESIKTKGFLSTVYSVFRYELQSYLSSPGLYAAVLAYVLIPIYLFFRSAYLSGNADIEPLFDILPWALLLFAPALTMRQLTEERRSGTYDVVVSNPVSESAIVVGELI